MSHPSFRHAILGLALAAALPAAAQQGATQEQLRREVESALATLGERDALGHAGQPLEIRRPAQVRYEIGAVVGVRGDQLEVLAVTPGSAAERMNLKAGDRLVAVNGTRLAPAPAGAAALDAAIGSAAGKARFDVVRNGQPLSLSGTADAIGIPAYVLTIGAESGSGCGYVTDIRPPPRSQKIFPAYITQVDGRGTPGNRVNRTRVSAGRHVLVVAEDIDRQRLNETQTRQILRLQRMAQKRAYKTLVVDVKPGTSLRVGARLLTDRLDNASIRANAYWEPVVWEEAQEACR